MKIIYFLLPLALVACQQSAKTKSTPAAAETSSRNLISFKVNGEPVRTSGWNISRLIWKEGENQWLNITSNMHEDKRTIMANLAGIAPGKYAFTETHTMRQSHANYKPDYAGDMLKSYSFINGSFDLTVVDTVKNLVSGTFSGQVRDAQGQVLNITEGKLVNCDMRAGIMKY